MRGPNGGHKWTPERTLKSFCLQEPESFSRDAKVLWCEDDSGCERVCTSGQAVGRVGE